jgi:hypothetical protein
MKFGTFVLLNALNKAKENSKQLNNKRTIMNEHYGTSHPAKA